MGTKDQNYADPDSCLNNADADEPIFVLRAQDALAPAIVREWAQRLLLAGGDDAKAQSANAVADEMEEWADANSNKLPD